MGPKKGAAAAADGEGEDISCDQFYKTYRKACQALEIPVNARIRAQYEEYVEEGKQIAKIHLWDELGWQGTKAIVDALNTANYRHLLSLRLWRGKCQDEGVRLVVNYLVKHSNCTILELLDCNITPLGCEFLNKAFTPRIGANLTMVKLDHNPLGDEGTALICQGLGRNQDITLLSLSYCEIGAVGAQHLFEVIIYTQSKIVELNLSGNPFGNEGIGWIFRGLACAKQLTQVYLSDCGWDDSEEVMEVMELSMVKNEVLAKYDLKHNSMSDEGIEMLCEILGKAPHVQGIQLSEWITSEAMNMLQEALIANKPAKGKGKKKKK